MADSPLTPSSFKLNTSSPLDTLVRKTSQRRDKVAAADHVKTRTEPVSTLPVSVLTAQSATDDTNLYVQPRMPILHSNFSRDSTATASTGTNIWYNDYNDSNSYADDSSIYSAYGDDSALRESWATGTGTAYGETMLDNAAPVPAVVVSPVIVKDYDSHSQTPKSQGGRTPSAAPTAMNFSKPMRHLTPESEEHKRRVLERNRHPSSPLAHHHHPPRNPSPLQPSTPSTMNSRFEQPYPSPPVQTPSPTASSHLSPYHPPSLTPHTPVSLPRKPPSLRPESPVSVYSDYSYYGSQPPTPTVSNTPGQSRAGPSPLSSQSRSTPTPTNAKPTPEDLLAMGITCHEANDLAASASYFQRAATEAGGCGVGMLMWGLTLRHGWGVAADEKTAFKWLRKAAESAVVDLEGARKGAKAGVDITSVKSELVLAIYEVAQCFFHGWGVSKDQKMAVSYYRVAARLGDADAQTDLGFCLANGRGCKKDRKEAAKWYRAAVQQGASDVGLAWIYKEKFQ